MVENHHSITRTNHILLLLLVATQGETTKNPSCQDTGCQSHYGGDARCVFVLNGNWSQIGREYDLSTARNDALCRSQQGLDNCCRCFRRSITSTTTTTTTTTITTTTSTTTSAGCTDVHLYCRSAFNGYGKCIDVRQGDLSDIDIDTKPINGRCGVGPEKCCECFKLKTKGSTTTTTTATSTTTTTTTTSTKTTTTMTTTSTSTTTSTTTTVVDGGWSSWSYGACSKTCGGGTQRGTRSCNNPRPSNGGKICTGSGVTTRQCNTKLCPGGCRTGWMEFGGRCYYVAKGTKTLSWDASVAECKKLDERSHLPSVGSQLEQDYIAQYAKDGYIFLGATDKDKEGQWKWTDGRPWTYTKWAPGEPNNVFGGTEHCAYMYPSRMKNEWNDVGCFKSYDNIVLMCSYNLKIAPVAVKMSSVWTGIHGEWTSLPGYLCIDNNRETKCHTKSKGDETWPWVAVEIPPSRVQQVNIVNRADCCGDRTKNVKVWVGDSLPTTTDTEYSQGALFGEFKGPANNGSVIPFTHSQGLEGKYVIVQMTQTEAINLAEIEVFGAPTSMIGSSK